MNVLLVINPVAGGVDHSPTIEKLKLKAEESGFRPEFHFTTGKSDEADLKRKMNQTHADWVIVGGGDGTVRMVAENLMGKELPLGILPMGSANGLATALAIPQDPIAAFERILQSTKLKGVDMLKFNDKFFSIHLADIGANALLVKKYAEGGVRGMIGYAKHLLASIKESTLTRAIVRTAEGILHKEGVMMAFANAHRYGTGVQISEGSVSDGKFEICNVERFALDNAIKAGLTALNVFIDRDMFSDVLSCKEAEVDLDRKTHFQVDGEYIGMIKHLKIEVIPSCIKLLV